jgi:hypothetical protein
MSSSGYIAPMKLGVGGVRRGLVVPLNEVTCSVVICLLFDLLDFGALLAEESFQGFFYFRC